MNIDVYTSQQLSKGAQIQRMKTREFQVTLVSGSFSLESWTLLMAGKVMEAMARWRQQTWHRCLSLSLSSAFGGQQTASCCMRD